MNGKQETVPYKRDLGSVLVRVMALLTGFISAGFGILLIYDFLFTKKWSSDFYGEDTIYVFLPLVIGVALIYAYVWLNPKKMRERELAQKMKEDVQKLAEEARLQEKAKLEAEWRETLTIRANQNQMSLWGQIISGLVIVGLFILAVIIFFMDELVISLVVGAIAIGIAIPLNWAKELEGKNVTELESTGFNIVSSIINFTPVILVLGLAWWAISWLQGLSVQSLLVVVVLLLVYIIWKKGL